MLREVGGLLGLPPPPVGRAEGSTLVDIGVRGIVAVPGGDGGQGRDACAGAGNGLPTNRKDEAEPHHWLEAAASGSSSGRAG